MLWSCVLGCLLACYQPPPRLAARGAGRRGGGAIVTRQRRPQDVQPVGRRLTCPPPAHHLQRCCLQFLTVGRLIGNTWRLWSRSGPLAGELGIAGAASPAVAPAQ